MRVYQRARRGGGRKGQEGPKRSTAFWGAAGHVDGGAEDFVTVIYARAESSVAIPRRHKVDSIAPLLSERPSTQRTLHPRTTSQRMKRWTRAVLPASARKKHREPCRQQLPYVDRQRGRTVWARWVERGRNEPYLLPCGYVTQADLHRTPSIDEARADLRSHISLALGLWEV